MKTPEVSLRGRLLVRLWVPLAALLLTGAVLSFAVSYHFAKLVFDRWLLDSAMTLATQLRIDTGHLTMALPPSAVEMFEWDSVDRIYEEVVAPSGRRVFGNVGFPDPPKLSPLQPTYYDGELEGQPVRIVAILVNSPADATRYATIQVAETLHKRKELLVEILYVLVPLQASLLIVAGAFIWFAVTSSLSTLDGVAARLRKYEASSLGPLGDALTAPTEVRPLVTAINTLITKLSDAQGAQQRFVANAAHQLRTPLAALQVNTERALRETEPKRHAEALEDVVLAVTRMRHLTQQLLTLTRSDPSAAGVLAMKSVSLPELVRDELGGWVDAAAARGIDLGYDGPETGPAVHGDPELLRALVGNLVDNAIRYGNRGGEITVGVGEAPSSIYVDDDGPGIPFEERERVLDPFYRSPQSRGDGCGLGLAIAREIAARHDATLQIAGNEPRGTRVTVIFAPRPDCPRPEIKKEAQTAA